MIVAAADQNERLCRERSGARSHDGTGPAGTRGIATASGRDGNSDTDDEQDRHAGDRRRQSGPHGQVAGLGAPLVTLVEIVPHHAPPSVARWKTLSYCVDPSEYVYVS